MARLKEEDIRRIIQEEAENEKRLSGVSEEALEVFQRLQRGQPLPVKPGKAYGFDMKVRDLEWKALLQLVIDTYWEVVEEDMNRD